MNPNVYIIAGPNGAGKTTFARKFLPNYAKCKIFVNADLIASGLSPFSPESQALRAGRLLIEQINLLAKKKVDFAFETTLSGMAYRSFFRKLKDAGYVITLFFLWLPSVDLSLGRIQDRVKRGGHNIPERVVRRRFNKTFQNLFKFYQPLLDAWILFDNSLTIPYLVAEERNGRLQVNDQNLFNKMLSEAGLL